VIAGTLDASGSAAALGTNSSIVGRLTAGGIGGGIILNDATLNARQVAIGRSAVLQSGLTAFGSLDRSQTGDFIAFNGATLAETVANANAAALNLGTQADLLFGVGATVAAENVIIGTGTPWKGLAGGRTTGTIQAGTVTVNSDFILQANNGNLVLGNAAASAVNFVDGGNGAKVATVTCALGGTGRAFNLVRLAGDNPTVTGIDKFVVAPNATFFVTGVNGLGGKNVDVQPGGLFGDPSNNTGNQSANALGNSTINLYGPTVVNLRANTAVNLGGTISVRGALPSEINANQGGTSGGAQTFTVTNLNFDADKTGVLLGSNNQKVLDFTNINGGSNNFTISTSYSPTLTSTWNGTSSGSFTKGEGNTLTLTGNLSGYAGNVIVQAGMLNMNPAVATNIFGGTGGTGLFKIADGNSLEKQNRGYGVLVVNTDLNWNSRIDATSTGILGLGGNNSTLTGVNGSSAFIAASGAARTLSTAALNPGAGSTYRLGGLGQSLTVSTAVLTGENNLVVGGYRDNFSGTFVYSGGAGTVVLTAVNDYTGTTLVNPGSTLTLNANNAIGGSANATAGQIDVWGKLNIGSNIASGAGTLRSIGAIFAAPINVNRDGLLLVDNRNALLDRIPDPVDVYLTAGTMTYQGNAAVGQETICDLKFAEGSTLVLTRGANLANNVTLNVNVLGRIGAGTLAVTSINNVLEAQESLVSATAFGPALLVAPYIVGTAGSGNFLAYTAGNSLVTATYNASAPASINVALNTDIYNSIGAGDPMNVAAVNVRALRAQGNVVRAAGSGAGTLSIGGAGDSVAGLMNTVNATVGGSSLADVATINFTSVGQAAIEAVVFNNSATTLTIGTVAGDTTVIANGFTKFGTGTTILNGSANNLGTVTVNQGTRQLNTTGVGASNISLNPGATLNLRANVATAFATAGSTITVQSAPTGSATINVNQLSAGSGVELSINNLTVNNDSRLAITGGNSFRLVANGATTFGANSVVYFGASSTPLVIRGTFSDTLTTTYRNDQNQFSGRYVSGLVFNNGAANNVVYGRFLDGNNQRMSLEAVGNGSVVTFQGYFAGGSSTSHLSAWDGGKLVIGSNATLDNSLGFTANNGGTVYQQVSEIAFSGSNGGIIEFDPGFVAKKTVGTMDRTDVNFGGKMRIGGQMTLVFNDTQNYPAYAGYMAWESQDATWKTTGNTQTAALPIKIGNVVNMDNQATLNITGPLLLGTAVSDATMQALARDLLVNPGLKDVGQDVAGTAPGCINKIGSGTLNINGALYVSSDSILNVTSGTLNVNGTVTTTTGKNILRLLTGAGTTLDMAGASYDIAAGHELTVYRNNVVAPDVTLGNGTSIKGNGTLVNLLIAGPGSLIDPGASPGILALASGLDMRANSTYKVELGGTALGQWDELFVTGGVSLAGNLNLQLNYTPTLGDKFVIIDNDAIDAVSGTLAGLLEGALVSAVSSADGITYNFQVSYLGLDASTGNDVVLTNVVPEPGTIVLLLAGALAGALVWWRRRN